MGQSSCGSIRLVTPLAEDSTHPIFKNLCDMVGDTKPQSKYALDVLLGPEMKGQNDSNAEIAGRQAKIGS